MIGSENALKENEVRKDRAFGEEGESHNFK